MNIGQMETHTPKRTQHCFSNIKTKRVPFKDIYLNIFLPLEEMCFVREIDFNSQEFLIFVAKEALQSPSRLRSEQKHRNIAAQGWTIYFITVNEDMIWLQTRIAGYIGCDQSVVVVVVVVIVVNLVVVVNLVAIIVVAGDVCSCCSCCY